MEGGDLSEWDTTVIDGGDLSAHADAARAGDYGMRAVINDTTAIYARDDDPVDLSRIRYGFYFNASSLTMDTSDYFNLAGGGSVAPGGADHRIALTYDGSNYKIRAECDDDGGAMNVETTWVTISTATWYWIEADFKISSGSNDGHVKLWVTSDPVTESPDVEETGLDNDTCDLDKLGLGAGNIAATTTGTLYFDYAVINDTGDAIGQPTTAQERASVATLATVWNAPSVIPDGTIALADRQHIAWSYAGIAAQSVSAATIPVIMHHRQQQGQS